MMLVRTLLASAVVFGGSTLALGGEESKPSVIPQPEKMELREGVFTLGPETAIVVNSETRTEGEYLAKLLATPTGFDFDVRESSGPDQGTNCVVLRTVSNKAQLGPEGYELTVALDRVLAEAPTAAGVFYACQTLRQLLPRAVESDCLVGGVAWTVPCVLIEDKPRYGWRGLMLDPGHNFLSKEFTKRYIDAMQKAYAFEPTLPGLSAEAAKHILGLEPCLWGFGQHRHDELVFPKLCAFAEVGWSPKELRNWDDFKSRLKPHGRRLDEMGINYRREAVFESKPWK